MALYLVPVGFCFTAITPDINECENGQHDCDAHAFCRNTIGSYSCTCGIGYEGDGIQCSATHAVLVLSTYRSSNKPMLVGFEGKSRLGTVRPTDAAVTRCNFNDNNISKIFQGWSTIIWSLIMAMKFPFNMDVELHYMGKCSILVALENINDR